MSSESFNSLYRKHNVRERYNRAQISARKKRHVVPDPDIATLSDDLIYQRARRDPVVDHAMTYRRHLITGREWWVEPGGPTEQDEQKAMAYENILRNHLERFASARFNLSVAFVRAQSFGFPVGERRMIDPLGDGRQVDMWVPTRIQDVDKFRLRQRTLRDNEGRTKNVWEFMSFERERWEVLQHPEWFISHVYEDVEYQLGYGRGLLETLYYFLYFKTETIDSVLKAIDKYASGWITAEIEDDRLSSEMLDNPKFFQKWLEIIDMMRGDYALVAPKGVKLGVTESNMTGMNAAMDTVIYYDNSMVRSILGATAPTGGGAPGSFARSRVEADSTEAIIQFDQQLLDETLTRDLFGLIGRLNVLQFNALGLGDAAQPHFRTRRESTVDPQTGIQILEGSLRSGLTVPLQEAHRLAGVRQPTELEKSRGDVVKPEDMPSSNPAPFGFMAPAPVPVADLPVVDPASRSDQMSSTDILDILRTRNNENNKRLGETEPEDELSLEG